MSATTQTEVRLMAITHADFIRSLKPLEKFYEYRVDENKKHIEISDGARHIQVQLGSEKSQQLGALQLPSIEVKFTFSKFTQQEIAQFWNRFDLCFRRGGG